METRSKSRGSLARLAIISAVVQLLAVVICTAVLFLFVALTYSKITLPEYTTVYPQKDVQQLLNLLVTVVATVIGILLSHCRRWACSRKAKDSLQLLTRFCRSTNEAETRQYGPWIYLILETLLTISPVGMQERAAQ